MALQAATQVPPGAAARHVASLWLTARACPPGSSPPALDPPSFFGLAGALADEVQILYNLW